MYWIAPNRAKYEPMIMQLAGIMQCLIDDKETPDKENPTDV